MTTGFLRTLEVAFFLAALVYVGGCSSEESQGATQENGEESEGRYSFALNDPGRSAADRDSDSGRRPEAILRFVGIREGMSVLDLMAGAGWYTEVLARSVRTSGRVVAHNSPLTHERYGDGLAARLKSDRLPNVETLVEEIDSLALESDSFDAVFLVQFYHDTYWMKIDRAEMNRRVFDALKPGGVFLVIDHAAVSGTGARDAESLHRVDEELVRDEVLASGFRLAETSDVLRNVADTRERNVFGWPLRGQTDRFALRFVKPGD
jgi:predicted methyltransferase